jgi:hypothetical protein
MDLNLLYDTSIQVTSEVTDEILRAARKHGEECMASPTLDVGKRLGILGEEYGEVCRATTYDNADRVNLREELIQTAAMAAAWVIALDLE